MKKGTEDHKVLYTCSLSLSLSKTTHVEGVPRGRRQFVPLFFYIAAANIHILRKQLCATRSLQPMTHQAFQDHLSALWGVPGPLRKTSRKAAPAHSHTFYCRA